MTEKTGKQYGPVLSESVKDHADPDGYPAQSEGDLIDPEGYFPESKGYSAKKQGEAE